jgi:hypothetical protein
VSRTLDAQAVELLRTAVATGDKTVDVYLDVERLVVVKVKDGRCVPEDLDADTVETDEERFAEIPVITEIDEHLLMQDFVDDRDEKRVTACLDDRVGANARFLKRLSKQAPDALPDWEAYRTAHVAQLVAEWLDELGVETAP